LQSVSTNPTRPDLRVRAAVAKSCQAFRAKIFCLSKILIFRILSAIPPRLRGCEPTENYSKSIGEARPMVGNIIRMLARAPKSRAGFHFAATIGRRAETRRLCSGCMTRSTRLHVFVQHYQHPGQKQKHRGNKGMTPKHEGHPKDCNDESNQSHPAIFQVAFVHILQQEEDYRDEKILINRAL
jgi:hypothetical protein